MTVKSDPAYKEYLVRILETTEKGYRKLDCQDVQSPVEAVHQRGGYL